MPHISARAATSARALLPRLGLLTCLLAVAALLAPALAEASGAAPSVTLTTPLTSAGRPLTNTSELVSGTVNPRGQTTTYFAEYAPSTSTFCGGTGAGSMAQTAAGVTLQATDSNPHAVSVNIPGLTSGRSYCAELAATNGAGTNVSTDPTSQDVQQTTFSAGFPVVTTPTAPDVNGPQQVTVHGTVDPAGQSTTYAVAYDLATSDFCTNDDTTDPTLQISTPTTTLPDQDAVAHDVSVNLTGLTPYTDYCAAIVASNGSTGGAHAYGADGVQAFETLPWGNVSALSSLSARSVQVSGTVNPDGVDTTYAAAYAPVGSDFCQNETGSYQSTTPVDVGAQDLNPHNVSVTIPNLTTGETYCVTFLLSNTPLGTHPGFLKDPDPDTGLYIKTVSVGLPTATTTDVAADAPTTAALDGSVGPSAQSTTYEVMYGPHNSNWCLSGGTQDSPAHTTTPQTLTQTDSGTYPVRVHLTGLTPGVQYCAALAAVNAANGQAGSPPASVGSTIDFTAGIAPSAGSAQSSDVSATTTTVTATANPEGQNSTVQIGYGPAGSTWCAYGTGTPANTTSTQPLTPVDTTDHTVTATLTNLQGGTSYCAAVIATNNSGSATGDTTVFVAGLPNASGLDSTTAGPTSQTLSGSITPTSQSTTYYAAYDELSSPWCQNGGRPSDATYSTSPVALGATDDTGHTVSVTITGLTPGQTYCAELVASNGSGDGATSAQAFTAGFPLTIGTTGTNSLGATSAAVDGTINPGGLATTYAVAFDLADSIWCSSGGQTGLPANTTTSASLPADTSDHPVSPSVTGLITGTDYCAELTATNRSGTVTGDQVDFTAGVATSIGGGTGGGDTGGSGDTGDSGDSGDTGGVIDPGSGAIGGDVGGSATSATTQPVTAPSHTSAPARVTVTAASVVTTTTAAVLGVGCPTASAASCRVTVTLTVTVKPKHGRSRTVVVGTRSASVAPGGRRVFSVSLNAAGKKLLRAQQKLSVRLAATQNGRSLARRTIRMVVPKVPNRPRW